MELDLYQVDAFAERVFTGNPAAVIPLTEWLDDETMQAIAEENNLSETAFFVPDKLGYDIRWFTPTIEVRLCGHATLATAKIIFDEIGTTERRITFSSKSGPLSVSKNDGQYFLDFPADHLTEYQDQGDRLSHGLGIHPQHIYVGRDDFLCILSSEDEVCSIRPDFHALSSHEGRGIIVTSIANASSKYDVVSRCFYPQSGIDEDPVTGSAHTTIIPYWAKILDKNNLLAYQASQRGGYLTCEMRDDRVLLGGTAVLYLRGTLTI